MSDVSVRTLSADRLAEFENALDAARADLESRVSGIVGNLEPPDLFEETEDGKRLDREALAGLLDNLDGVWGAVEDAFDDFNWRVNRELRVFKKALS